MGIFSRKKKAASDATASQESTGKALDADDATETETSAEATTDVEHDDEASERQDGAENQGDEDGGATAPKRLNSRDVDRTEGPFDRSEVDDLEGLIDFGSLAIRPVSEMELRLEVNEAGTEITGITGVIGDSAVQLQAFAAPKSRGVWDAIRGEIHTNLTAGKGEAEEVEGPLGMELRAVMASPGPDGRTVRSAMTFVGVDGPRWFLRAVISGRAAADESAREEILRFVRGTVVTRGGEPRAPREMLPIDVPDSVEMPGAEAPVADDSSVPNPFKRGPEITEVR